MVINLPVHTLCRPIQMHQKRGNNMLIVCFLRKTLMFTNTAPDAKKRKKACNLCETYKLIRPTHELPFPLITIVAEPQHRDT